MSLLSGLKHGGVDIYVRDANDDAAISTAVWFGGFGGLLSCGRHTLPSALIVSASWNSPIKRRRWLLLLPGYQRSTARVGQAL